MKLTPGDNFARSVGRAHMIRYWSLRTRSRGLIVLASVPPDVDRLSLLALETLVLPADDSPPAVDFSSVDVIPTPLKHHQATFHYLQFGFVIFWQKKYWCKFFDAWAPNLSLIVLFEIILKKWKTVGLKIVFLQIKCLTGGCFIKQPKRSHMLFEWHNMGSYEFSRILKFRITINKFCQIRIWSTNSTKIWQNLTYFLCRFILFFCVIF